MFLEHYEFELSFDMIMNQLHEYDIKIDKEFYNLTIAIIDKIKIDNAKYDHIKKLIL